jgi:putative transcriptional regulator
MPLIVNLDVVLAKRKMRSNDLAEKIGITAQNLSILKTGKARAIRFATLEKLCEVLQCQPGDILEYRPAGEPVNEPGVLVVGHGQGSDEAAAIKERIAGRVSC